MREFALIKIEEGKQHRYKWQQSPSSDETIRIIFTDIKQFTKGRIFCQRLRKNYSFTIERDIQPYDLFFVDRIVDKKSEEKPNNIYCIVQFSRFDFFPIPFRINKQNISLFDKSIQTCGYYYFPTLLKKISTNELPPVFSLPPGETASFFQNIIKYVVSSTLIKETLTYDSLKKLLIRKDSKAKKFIGFCLLLLIVIIIGIEALCLKDFYNCNKTIIEQPLNMFTAKFFCFFGICFCMHLILPSLNMLLLNTEHMILNLFSTKINRSWPLKNYTIKLEINNFNGVLANEKEEKISLENLSKLREYHTALIGISLSIILLLIAVIF